MMVLPICLNLIFKRANQADLFFALTGWLHNLVVEKKNRLSSDF